MCNFVYFSYCLCVHLPISCGLQLSRSHTRPTDRPPATSFGSPENPFPISVDFLGVVGQPDKKLNYSF